MTLVPRPLVCSLAMLLLTPLASPAGEGPEVRTVPTQERTVHPQLAPSPGTRADEARRQPLSPEGALARERALERSHLPGPPAPPRGSRAPRAGGKSTSPPPASAPRPAGEPRADGGPEILQSIDLYPVIPDSLLSTTSEPSVAVTGSTVFVTGNWFATLSDDGGDSYETLDPESEPFAPPAGQSFCCDQVTIYDPRSDSIFWLQQFSAPPDNAGNVQRINVDRGGDGSFDCFYDFTASDFSLQEDSFLDFPDLQVGDTYLYATTNSYSPGASDNVFRSSVVNRLALDDIGRCDSVASRFYTSSQFSPRVAAGIGSTAYFGYNGFSDSGPILTLAAWPESSDSIDLHDVSLDLPDDAAYGSYRCPGPDGTDMCQRADRRLLGAYRAGGIVGFLWNEPQGGSFPYPYVAIARIQESDASLVSQGSIWNSDYAWLYPSVAPNGSGVLGGTMAYGGGNRDPGCAAWTSGADIDADFEAIEVINGDSGPASNRWGDYLTTRRNPDDGSTWDGTCYALMGSGQNGSTHPVYVRFSAGGTPPSNRGTTLTPDELTFLVNKDRGGARWAISLNTIGFDVEDAFVSSGTGNVYFTDDSQPAFVDCTPNPWSSGTVWDPESVFDFFCAGADPCPTSALECADLGWSVINTSVELQASFFLPPGGLGAGELLSAPLSTRPPALVAAAGPPRSASGRRLRWHSSIEAAGALAPAHRRGGGPAPGAGTTAGQPAAGEPASATDRGVALTPDLMHFLVSKPRGGARWAISLNYLPISPTDFVLDDATGNVFFTDDSPPSFVYCTPNPGQTGTVENPASTFSFTCWGTDPCPDTALACAHGEWRLIDDDVELQASFFLPPGGL